VSRPERSREAESSGLGEGRGGDAPSDPVRFLSDMQDFESSAGGSELPLVLAFSATWCAPCAWLDPYLLELVREGAGELVVRKADVDALPELAERFRIGSVPTVLLFLGGQEVERSVGVEPERLRAMAARAARSASDD
jgi:thioredoxin 1